MESRVSDAALVSALEREADVVSAYLFGSHAEIRAHRDSDVDVAVLLDRSMAEPNGRVSTSGCDWVPRWAPRCSATTSTSSC